MRKLALAATLTMIVTLLAAAPASAGPRQSAGDFAADCNDDGQVTVDGRQVYRGGSGSLDGLCSVVMEPGAALVFRNVAIDGVGGLVAISSPADTTIRVIRSSFAIDGPLELTAGCCAGEGDGSERKGRVVVKRSTLEADSIQLLASFDDPDGRVVVRRSSLTATGELGVQLRASDLAGSDGLVRVHRSEIDSAGDLRISTGASGRTVVRRTTAVSVGEAELSTGEGGRCVVRRSTPDFPCVVTGPEVGGDEGEEGEEPGEEGEGGDEAPESGGEGSGDGEVS